jgi:hypothetical protein
MDTAQSEVEERPSNIVKPFNPKKIDIQTDDIGSHFSLA